MPLLSSACLPHSLPVDPFPLSQNMGTLRAVRLRLDDDGDSRFNGNGRPDVDLLDRCLDRNKQRVAGAQVALVPGLQFFPPSSDAIDGDAPTSCKICCRTLPGVGVKGTAIPGLAP